VEQTRHEYFLESYERLFSVVEPAVREAGQEVLAVMVVSFCPTNFSTNHEWRVGDPQNKKESWRLAG
jgi:hypothetical protein